MFLTGNYSKMSDEGYANFEWFCEALIPAARTMFGSAGN